VRLRLPGILGALALLAAGCGGGEEPPPPVVLATDTPAPVEIPVDPTFAPPAPDEAVAMGPEDTLAAWIAAQEAGDFGWTMSLVVEEQREAFQQAVDEMATDDLISSGLQFRDEAYALEFQDQKMALFWSDAAKLYLVMTHEDGEWRVDPARTDEMNAQRQAAEGS